MYSQSTWTRPRQIPSARLSIPNEGFLVSGRFFSHHVSDSNNVWLGAVLKWLVISTQPNSRRKTQGFIPLPMFSHILGTRKIYLLNSEWIHTIATSCGKLLKTQCYHYVCWISKMWFTITFVQGELLSTREIKTHELLIMCLYILCVCILELKISDWWSSLFITITINIINPLKKCQLTSARRSALCGTVVKKYGDEAQWDSMTILANILSSWRPSVVSRANSVTRLVWD